MINTEWKIIERCVYNADMELIAASFLDDSKDESRVLDAICTIPSAVDLFKRLLADNHFKTKDIREEVWAIIADLDVNFVSGENDEPLTDELAL